MKLGEKRRRMLLRKSRNTIKNAGFSLRTKQTRDRAKPVARPYSKPATKKMLAFEAGFFLLLAGGANGTPQGAETKTRARRYFFFFSEGN